jgi:hypothetical protein
MRVQQDKWYLTRDKSSCVLVKQLVADEHGYVCEAVCSDGVDRNERGMIYRSTYDKKDLVREIQVCI